MSLKRDHARPIAFGCACGARGVGQFEADDPAGLVLGLAGPFTARDGGGARCLLCGSPEAAFQLHQPPEDAKPDAL